MVVLKFEISQGSTTVVAATSGGWAECWAWRCAVCATCPACTSAGAGFEPTTGSRVPSLRGMKQIFRWV